jgi:N-carbamoylputrescine amidase
MNTAQTFTVAAVQMTCQDGKVQENLDHAVEFVMQASAQGARLIVFPELMPQGYLLTPDLWSTGEPLDGLTTRWLCEQAQNFGVYIGTSFLESDGEDFWNTFALSTPAGKIAGTVRKRFPSMWEAYFFKGHRSRPYIDTDQGRLGVGVCFDNHTYEVAQAIAASQVDLMLMPHSYCTPSMPTKMVTQADIDRLNDNPIRVARLYNDWFGIPVILVNKSGAWDSPVPKTILGRPQGYRFSGRSMILDADGRVCAQLGVDEGMALAEIHLDPARKKQSNPPKYSRYIYPGPAGREILRLIEWNGYLNYVRNRQRKQVARSITAPEKFK